jgi:hypothetical protein
MPFEIGDVVRYIGPTSLWSYGTNHSEDLMGTSGVVEHARPFQSSVRAYIVRWSGGRSWDVLDDQIVLAEGYVPNISNSKYNHIIQKIRRMDSVRKALGYVY